MRILFFLLIGLVLPTFFVSAADAESTPAVAAAIYKDIADEIEALCIYEVRDGLTVARVFSGPKLNEIQETGIRLEGYVSGVVLLSDKKVDASVAGSPMRKVRAGSDGYRDLAGYGNLEIEELAKAFRDEGRFDFNRDLPTGLESPYAYLPKVPGDAVCAENRFSIVVKDIKRVLEIPVFQSGSMKIPGILSETEAVDRLPEIRYLGNDRDRLKASDFKIRMNAISDGIRAVESAVDEELVASVFLLDYDGPDNALTCEGRSEIWIYSRTFWKESPEELRAIAEHETLHILADRGRLAKNAALRDLFADLRGLDVFSLERFFLATTGSLPRSALRTEDKSSDHILLAFVNEMNFFEGMKGGHSRDSLDEFCASFLHTLLYDEELENALRRPVVLPDADPRALNPDEQKSLLEDYVAVTEKLVGVADKESANETLANFLGDRLRKVRKLSDPAV